MPFYEYECTSCKFYTELMQKISDTPLKKCPSCGKSTMKKLISAPVFRLKGGGWYETDFKSDKESKRNLAGDDGPDAKARETPPPADAKAGDSQSGDKKSGDTKAGDSKPESKPAEKAGASDAGASGGAASRSASKSSTGKPASAAAKPAAKAPARKPAPKVKAKAKASKRRGR
jgi:putative FmdB family regulatory protein